MDFDVYREWCRTEAACLDCGRKLGERASGEAWPTETQCMSCWERHGAPETRGLPSSLELFEQQRSP